MNTIRNSDGKYVVIERGQRVSQPMDSREKAQQEADKRNKVQESSGQPVPENRRAQVKQNILG